MKKYFIFISLLGIFIFNGCFKNSLPSSYVYEEPILIGNWNNISNNKKMSIKKRGSSLIIYTINKNKRINPLKAKTYKIDNIKLLQVQFDEISNSSEKNEKFYLLNKIEFINKNTLKLTHLGKNSFTEEEKFTDLSSEKIVELIKEKNKLLFKDQRDNIWYRLKD